MFRRYAKADASVTASHEKVGRRHATARRFLRRPREGVKIISPEFAHEWYPCRLAVWNRINTEDKRCIIQLDSGTLAAS
jgi:hypothetical protein